MYIHVKGYNDFFERDEPEDGFTYFKKWITDPRHASGIFLVIVLVVVLFLHYKK